ncbi:hypothetical protein LZ30DRAFT_733288 [Colletotrichum cereale]|nr:hypothetical protein LZ30DRAFT_733288 [Colletotrichum cereale]
MKCGSFGQGETGHERRIRGYQLSSWHPSPSTQRGSASRYPATVSTLCPDGRQQASPRSPQYPESGIRDTVGVAFHSSTHSRTTSLGQPQTKLPCGRQHWCPDQCGPGTRAFRASVRCHDSRVSADGGGHAGRCRTAHIVLQRPPVPDKIKTCRVWIYSVQSAPFRPPRMLEYLRMNAQEFPKEEVNTSVCLISVNRMGWLRFDSWMLSVNQNSPASLTISTCPGQASTCHPVCARARTRPRLTAHRIASHSPPGDVLSQSASASTFASPLCP